jgi:hypothetical protein
LDWSNAFENRLTADGLAEAVPPLQAGNANLSERDFEALVSIYDRCNDYVTFWSLYSKIVPVNPPSGCEASAYPYDARNRRT